MTDLRTPVPFGQTGLRVCRLGIGSSFIRDPAIIEEAVDQGVNYLYWGSIRRPAFGRAAGRRRRAPAGPDAILSTHPDVLPVNHSFQDPHNEQLLPSHPVVEPPDSRLHRAHRRRGRLRR